MLMMGANMLRFMFKPFGGISDFDVGGSSVLSPRRCG